ncbi:MAG: hypothetical protein JXM71_08230 [Spirochaetales bacterium]|nr:hypothetical protein [Spirochaetales bacterium]
MNARRVLTTRTRRCALLVCMASLVMSSCWHPAFNPELSLTMNTVQKMNLVSTIRVTGIRQSDADRGFFVPRRVSVPVDGIWLAGQEWGDIAYRNTVPLYLASGASSSFTSVSPITYEPLRPYRPVVRASPTGAKEALGFGFRSAGRGPIRLYSAMVPDSAGPIQRDDSSTVVLNGGGGVLGLGFAPYDALGDAGFAIYYDDTLMAWQALEFSYSGGTPLSGTGNDIAIPPALSPTRVGFTANSGAYWYLSITDADGVSTTYRWPSTALMTQPGKLQGVTLPLVAVLSDGKLLSGDGTTLTAHEADGTPLFSVLASGLYFAHERYDTAAGAWLMVFCRQLFASDGRDEYGTLLLDVYELPTADLETLAD